MIDEPFSHKRYSEKDLYRDLDILRKAGIIQVEGISDDGHWLYSMTEEGKRIVGDTDNMNYEALAEVFETIEKYDEESE